MPKELRTRNISLPASLDDYIKGLVEQGEFSTYSEAIRNAIRQHQLLQRNLAWRSERWRQAIEDGRADLAAGRFGKVPGTDLYEASLEDLE